MWLGPSSSFSYLIYLIIITLEREWQSLSALNLSYCFLTFLTWGWHTEENEIVFLHSMTLHAIKIKWESNEEIDRFFLHGTHDLSMSQWNETSTLWKLFVDSWLESCVMASIGYKGALPSCKLIHYCWETLTMEYPGNFFYSPLAFQIFNKIL